MQTRRSFREQTAADRVWPDGVSATVLQLRAAWRTLEYQLSTREAGPRSLRVAAPAELLVAAPAVSAGVQPASQEVSTQALPPAPLPPEKLL